MRNSYGERMLKQLERLPVDTKMGVMQVLEEHADGADASVRLEPFCNLTSLSLMLVEVLVDEIEYLEETLEDTLRRVG